MRNNLKGVLIEECKIALKNHHLEQRSLSKKSEIRQMRHTTINLVNHRGKHLYFIKIQPSLFLRGTPLFTKRLFEGISVAEEPLKKKGKESFGQHRCRIISEGIFKAYRNNVLNKHEVLNLIIGNLSKWKVNIKYPFLNAGSVDIYNLIRE